MRWFRQDAGRFGQGIEILRRGQRAQLKPANTVAFTFTGTEVGAPPSFLRTSRTCGASDQLPVTSFQ